MNVAAAHQQRTRGFWREAGCQGASSERRKGGPGCHGLDGWGSDMGSKIMGQRNKGASWIGGQDRGASVLTQTQTLATRSPGTQLSLMQPL